jgi:hypothetical protein
MHSLKLLLAIVALVMAGLAIQPAEAKPGKGWGPPGHAKAWGHRAKVRPYAYHDRGLHRGWSKRGKVPRWAR